MSCMGWDGLRHVSPSWSGEHAAESTGSNVETELRKMSQLLDICFIAGCSASCHTQGSPRQNDLTQDVSTATVRKPQGYGLNVCVPMIINVESLDPGVMTVENGAYGM